MVDMKLQKKEATAFLNKRGRRIEMILYGLLLVFVIFAPLYLYSYLEYLLITLANAINLTKNWQDILSVALPVFSGACAIISVIFITFPVFHSFFTHSYKLYRAGLAGAPCYLPRDKGGYDKALRSGAVLGVIFVLCLLPLILLVSVCRPFAFHEDERIAALVSYLFFLIVAAGLALGFVVFLLFRPLFLFGYYSARGRSVRQSLSFSVKAMRAERAKTLYGKYIRAFLPSLLLSLLTLLVLFFLDTLPKMTMVYYRVADEITYGE